LLLALLLLLLQLWPCESYCIVQACTIVGQWWLVVGAAAAAVLLLLLVSPLLLLLLPLLQWHC
jgi:hypothetical protein